jgi:hypothetical protein
VRSGTTWTQQAYLKASNADAEDFFGIDVAISGDTIVVGAEDEKSNATGVNGNQSDNSATFAGAAYVFVRSGTTWTQQAYLKASNTDAFDFYGRSVAISGDTIVVGALNESSNATGVNGNQSDNSAGRAGAAYVYVRSGATWTQQAYLKASNTNAFDAFGISVAIDRDTILVGAVGEGSNATGVNGNQSDNSLMDAGAAYVFVRNATTWSQQAYLKASNTDNRDEFGWAAAIAGDTIVIGTFEESSAATGVNGNQSDNSAPRAGAAYVYVRNGTSWTQQAYLKASNTNANDTFGGEVAISGDTILIGALGESSSATGVNGNQSDNSATNAGAAYVFVGAGSGITQLQNIATRIRVDSGDKQGIAGFIISGSSPKRVIVRGLGPSLAYHGISEVLADPVLELHGPSGELIATNDNWRDTQQTQIEATLLSPLDNRESAAVATLPPGGYTAILGGKNQTGGVGLVEVYNLDGPGALSRLGNISTRANVGTGSNVAIGGFIINGGQNNVNVVIRGLGPSLMAAGLTNVLADPVLELRNADGELLISNHDWQDEPSQAALITATGLAPASLRDAAMYISLSPGLYTTILAGENNGTGVGSIEIYDVP